MEEALRFSAAPEIPKLLSGKKRSLAYISLPTLSEWENEMNFIDRKRELVGSNHDYSCEFYEEIINGFIVLFIILLFF